MAQLTRELQETLIRDGYVQVPGAVPRPVVDAALRAINHDLSQGMDPAKMWQYHSQSFCPELRAAKVIRDLFDASAAASLVEGIVGPGALRTVDEGQIALRFPALGELTLNQPHVDGIADPKGHNGVPVGTILNFTALACVLLSDLPTTYAGNFMVWPGTHRTFAAYLRTHGVDTLLSRMPSVPLPQPVQITGRAGDLIIAHHLLGHSVAPNHSPNIRYACFFRLWSKHRGQAFPPAMLDEFLEWPGVAHLLGGSADAR
jgi:hypothetical protein